MSSSMAAWDPLVTLQGSQRSSLFTSSPMIAPRDGDHNNPPGGPSPHRSRDDSIQGTSLRRSARPRQLLLRYPDSGP